MFTTGETLPPLSMKTPVDGPIIQKLPAIDLSPEIEGVLKAMFANFSRIAIEMEFHQGLSLGRVFQVRPVEATGQAHLPVVVKVAPLSLIHQEWHAYQTWVAGKLPSVVRLEAPPTLRPDSAWDGLCYGLGGENVSEVQSLYYYYHQASSQDLWWLLAERLYQIIGVNWWLDHRLDRAFQMQAEYDAVLPVNLILKPIEPPPGSQVQRLTAEQLSPAPLTRGSLVQLERFMVTEIDPARLQVTLNLAPTPAERPLTAYRLRLVGVANPADYGIGQIINSLTGQVVETRQDILMAKAGEALGVTHDLTVQQLAIPLDQRSWLAGVLPTLPPSHLPNPLQVYPEILNSFMTVNLSTIHGDLNLENILVDPQTRHLNLIDFATVRQGHALHDLLRLETEVVTKLVSAVVAEAGLPPLVIYAIYQQLSLASLPLDSSNLLANLPSALEKTVTMLAAIRKMARSCLFNPEDWGEYYRSLILYMLGALKFKNLDTLPHAPLPKQLAFWAAATGAHLLLMPPTQSRPQMPEVETAPHRPLQLYRPIQAGGDVIQVGNISGSNLAIGREAQVNLSQQINHHETIQLFQTIQQQIELHLSDMNKETLSELITKIQTEVERAEGANPNKIRRWLRQLIELDPNISRMTITGLARPLPGVTPTIRQIAAKASQELDDADEPGF